MRVEIAILSDKIPPNAEALMKNIADLENTLRAKTISDNVKFCDLERDVIMLKKKQNLSELEHRVCQKIEDVAIAMTKTMSDKFDTNKKFRLMEYRQQCLLELLLMSVGVESANNFRGLIDQLAKGSKKLQNPNLLLTHIKAQLKLKKQLEQKDGYESTEDDPQFFHASPLRDEKNRSPVIVHRPMSRNNRGALNESAIFYQQQKDRSSAQLKTKNLTDFNST